MTADTYRLIQCGDAARDAGRWNHAVAAYRAAIAADPGLHHIRIQLGHMLKQAGSLDEADATYAEAAQYRADDAEPVIHRAHLAKQRDDSRVVLTLFISALARGDWGGRAEHELRRMLGLDAAVSGDALRRLLFETDVADHRPETAQTGIIKASKTGERSLVFDITDLIGHFRHRRLPTGIQRVQIEVLRAVLRSQGVEKMALGCFVAGRNGMICVSIKHFLELIALAGSNSDVAEASWQEARARLFLHLALAEQIVWPWRSVLVNIGTSLWVSDYFLFIRNAKVQQQISYVPFVHDLIPIRVPEYCVHGLKQDFAAWLVGLFQHADGFLVNSCSTARDLEWAAKSLGRTVGESRVEVVPLDADPRPTVDPLPSSTLDRWGLLDIDFALMVSTIEPRKNHLLAFDAWAELIRIRGASCVPRLVCVGHDGWLNDQVFARLAADPALIAGVTIIDSVSDAEMALLYRCSSFTLYPSHYEGWGLPVTESLCYGKVPVIADNSSLPEAGAGLALMFESGSVTALVHAINRVAFDVRWRQRQEARIKAEFAPRSWSQIAAQIVDAARRTAAAPETDAVVPTVYRGVYYPISLHRAPNIWPGLMSGEIFRIGDGWLWPEVDRCRTTPQGGTLQMRLTDTLAEVGDGAGEPLQLYLRLRGLVEIDCPVIVTAGDREVNATIPAGAVIWVACDLPTDHSPIVSVTVRGLAAEEVMMSMGGQERSCSASVAVAGLLLGDRSTESANQRAIASIDRWRCR